jgi:hypothetical protein
MKLILTGAAVCVTAGQALAVSLAYEGFVYPPGTPMNGVGGCCGWGGPWTAGAPIVAAPPNLAYPIALPSAGVGMLNPAVGEAWRPFMPGISNIAGDVWVSFMEQTLAPGSRAMVSLDAASGSGLPSIVMDKDPAGAFTLSCAGFLTAPLPGHGPGNVDFIVLHIRQFMGGFTRLEVWVNPTFLPSPPTAVIPLVPSPCGLARFYWRTEAGQLVDEIRVGTTLSDVSAVSSPCYANCDGSTTSPCLNVLDFSCFLNRYAAGDTYANCDGSTTAPVLNVLDFSCFLNQYAAGCSVC